MNETVPHFSTVPSCMQVDKPTDIREEGQIQVQQRSRMEEAMRNL